MNSTPAAECNLRVFERLLHAIADGVVVVLGFKDSEGQIGFVRKDVVGLLGFTALDGLPANDDAAIREIGFLADLGHHVPFFSVRAEQRGRDELRADIGLGKGFFVHAARARVDCPVASRGSSQ